MRFDTDKNDKELWEEALELWGFTSQFVMFFEETAELQQEITKLMRGFDNPQKIVDEMADVQIVLNQLKYILSIIYPKNFEDINENLNQSYETKKLKLKQHIKNEKEQRKNKQGKDL